MKKIFIAVAVLVLAVGGAYAFEKQSEADEVTVSSKNIAIDPNDPQFNPMEFKLDNYKSTADAAHALYVMFPEGTDRKYVEEVLVGHAGAKAMEQLPGTVTYYLAKPFRVGLKIGDMTGKCSGDWIYEITYDRNDKVEKRRVPCW